MRYEEQQTETALTSGNNCFVWACTVQIDVEGLARAHHQSPSTAIPIEDKIKTCHGCQ